MTGRPIGCISVAFQIASQQQQCCLADLHWLALSDYISAAVFSSYVRNLKSLICQGLLESTYFIKSSKWNDYSLKHGFHWDHFIKSNSINFHIHDGCVQIHSLLLHRVINATMQLEWWKQWRFLFFIRTKFTGRTGMGQGKKNKCSVQIQVFFPLS